MTRDAPRTTRSTRRGLLALGAAVAAAAVGASLLPPEDEEVAPLPLPGFDDPTPPRPSASASEAGPRWPGHVPGKVYLGWADGGDLAATLAVTGPVSLRRSFFEWWSLDRERKRIAEDHRAGRLPWVSFQPPSRAPGIWARVAAGEFDDDLRRRARMYAEIAGPVVVTFNHEPHNDSRRGTPEEYARAWVRTHDVVEQETGLANVASVPVLGEWSFSPLNPEADPHRYLPDDVLSRMSFLGVDIYQNRMGEGFDVRLGRVLSWLDTQGYRDAQIGIGETGATNAWRPPTAAHWWTSSWSWVTRNVDRVGAVAYWNSDRNDPRANWLLSESDDKSDAFRASLADPVVVKRLEL